MARYLYNGAILLFVNFILLASSLRTYDVRKLGEERLLLTDDDSMTDNELVQSGKYGPVHISMIHVSNGLGHIHHFCPTTNRYKFRMYTRLLEEDRGTRFIGDLVVGERRADETIFRRTVEVSNPTDDVYSTTINLSVSNGIIHYMSILNDPGSYAVACDEPYSLGTSKSGFNVRVLPNSKSSLTMVVAAH